MNDAPQKLYLDKSQINDYSDDLLRCFVQWEIDDIDSLKILELMKKKIKEKENARNIH